MDIPRWAFVRVDEERAKFLGVLPNPGNADVWMRDYFGWRPYHMFAAYIAQHEDAPVE